MNCNIARSILESYRHSGHQNAKILFEEGKTEEAKAAREQAFSCEAALEHLDQPNFAGDIRFMHAKFGIERPPTPRMTSPHITDFRSKFLEEEVKEFLEEIKAGNVPKAAHEAMDILVIVFGTMDEMGIPVAPCWNEVLRANMAKERATSPEQSKRGSTRDLVKPEGWVRANVKPALEAAGFSDPEPPGAA